MFEQVLVDAENGGNLIVAPSAVEEALRIRNRTSTGNHSLTAYRDCMEACFHPDDLMDYLPKVGSPRGLDVWRLYAAPCHMVRSISAYGQ
jgi:hypothetical protein